MRVSAESYVCSTRFCCAWRRLLVNAFTKHISARIVVCVVIVFGMNGGTLQIFV